MDLEGIWRLREEQIYPSLFGKAQKGIFTLSQSVFCDRFGQTAVDPRWLFYGVFEFPPIDNRPFWIYVTSGHSNPWDNAPEATMPNCTSGAGLEFLLASKESGEWAIRQMLDILAFDILLRAGRYPGKPPLANGDRIPLRAPINSDTRCTLRNLLVTNKEQNWPGFNLPYGMVQFLTLLGITDAEVAYAKASGSDALVESLEYRRYYPVTDVCRPSIF